jgi:hypothetical protein
METKDFKLFRGWFYNIQHKIESIYIRSILNGENENGKYRFFAKQCHAYTVYMYTLLLRVHKRCLFSKKCIFSKNLTRSRHHTVYKKIILDVFLTKNNSSLFFFLPLQKGKMREREFIVILGCDDGEWVYAKIRFLIVSKYALTITGHDLKCYIIDKFTALQRGKWILIARLAVKVYNFRKIWACDE